MSRSKTHRRRNGTREPAVLGVLRENFKSRTPGMPLPLRAKISAAIASEQKAGATKPRRRTRKPFFGLGYTGTLLAACLAVAVGLAWYTHHARERNLHQVRASGEGVREGATARIVRAQAADVIEGRAALEPAAGRTPALECLDPAWTAVGVRAAGADAARAWLVYTDGRERVAVLLSAAEGEVGEPTGTVERPTRWSEGGVHVAAARIGAYVVAVCGTGGRETPAAVLRCLSARDGR
jgi:hypothetical protein